MCRVRLSGAAIGFRPLDRGGAVSTCRMRNLAIQLDELGVIDIGPETGLNRLQVCAMPVAGDLDPDSEPLREIAHKLGSRLAAAVADPPGRHQLGFGVDGNPCPQIARTFRGILSERHVTGLGVAKRPNFVELQPAARQVAERPVLIVRECFAGILRSLMIVFLLAPVIRTMARMLLPSTIMPRICARRSLVSLFILTNMLESGRESKS